MAAAASSFDHYLRSNGTVHDERDDTLRVTEGVLPPALRGVLYRNGPGKMEVFGTRYDHPFDGDGMVTRFSFDGRAVHYRNRFVRTSEYAAEQRAGRMLYRSFGTNLPGGLRRNFLRLRFKNAANTSVVLHGGKLLPQYCQAWANYYVKFIKEYERLGVPIWGLTVQNEPMATQKWESCVFTAEDERDFIKGFLGPTLRKGGLGDKKLIAWDHNRDLLYQRASTVLNDPDAAQYVWGIGYHWYETWTTSGMLFDNERRVQETFPNTHLLFTEGCAEAFKLDHVNDWALGERYGYSMLNDFNAGTVGWTDWNVLLDETGGPNHVGNFCFAPVIADTKAGKLLYTNAYYYIGHFSKFVRPGARRVATTSNRDWLQTTAFRNSDGKLAVVVLNQSDKKQDFQLWLQGQAAPATSLPHSIMTFVVQ